jgi:hypothetical protein
MGARVKIPRWSSCEGGSTEAEAESAEEVIGVGWMTGSEVST